MEYNRIMKNRVVIIEELEQGWDTYIREVDTGHVDQRLRWHWKTYEEAEAHACGMLNGITYFTDQIVTHGLGYERLDDK